MNFTIDLSPAATYYDVDGSQWPAIIIKEDIKVQIIFLLLKKKLFLCGFLL